MSCWILRTVSEALRVLCAGSNPFFEPFWWLWSFGGGFHGASSQQNLHPTTQVPASWYLLLAPRATSDTGQLRRIIEFRHTIPTHAVDYE